MSKQAFELQLLHIQNTWLFSVTKFVKPKCLTLQSAWKPASVNCEHWATSSVLQEEEIIWSTMITIFLPLNDSNIDVNVISTLSPDPNEVKPRVKLRAKPRWAFTPSFSYYKTKWYAKNIEGDIILCNIVDSI